MNAPTLRRHALVLAAAGALLAAPAAAPAGSIWAKGKRRTRQVYADDTAKGVGDSVTIVIEEESKIENETTRSLDKSNSRSAEASGSVDLGNMVSWLEGRIWKLPNVDVSHEAGNKFDGKATLDSDRKVTDRFTVTVEDVLPNGNLVVVGKREREVDGDNQVVQASGIIRPSDVAFDNTVSSKKVAEFKLVYKAVGRESKFTKPGWLAQILNALNPE